MSEAVSNERVDVLKAMEDAASIAFAAMEDSESVTALEWYQMKIDDLNLAIHVVNELIESCRPAAAPDGWTHEEYCRFVSALDRIGAAR